ncbi:MAG TPA: tryptophan--tRNA ligase [Candidatus Borkfalkia faecipullorum]|mgnify:FL=1|uniref:Tryptophan--tRNA ligase n=1 Tax=Candidatus Borkfalkia faecipullorum TaxID=2838510 RepID=A0A9D2AEX2_9FIRM|nr:tryptophan--tRNA ligase [Candidatus Borkfalkia faecipullorum]
MEEKVKSSLFSAVQPSGAVTIGNYIGAIRNFVKLQDEYNCIYAVADLHAITVRQEPAVLRRNTLELMALFLACGIDPKKCVLFVQSHVPAHCELAWVLNTISYPGELSRMTQFKDKSAKHAENVNMGLMDYPVLMAADILLYQAALVPVGADQKQHLELTRDLAIRFNNRYGQTFTVPDGYILKDSGARIMSLADPSKKMSKSDDNPNAFVTMGDDRDSILRKFKRAVTDSDSEIRYDPENKPGVSNLLTIYHAFTGKSLADSEREFAGKGYGEFKEAVGEAVADALAPIQAEKARLLADKAYINSIISEGDNAAFRMARKTLSKVYRKIGFYSGE